MHTIVNGGYDLIITDVEYGGLPTLKLIRDAKNSGCISKFLIFTAVPENPFSKKYFTSGVDGYLQKTSSLVEIKLALENIMANKKYLSQEVKDFLCNEFLYKERSLVSDLSHQEIAIAKRLVSGQGISEIALLLNLHTSTIGTHKSRIFKKLKIENIIELKEHLSVINMPAS